MSWVNTCARFVPPRRVLGGNGLLKGRRYVCSGELWRQVTDGVYVDADVVEDGNLISGRGSGRCLIFP